MFEKRFRFFIFLNDDLPAAHAVPGEDAGRGVGGVPEQAAHDARVVGAEGRAAGGQKWGFL